MAVKRGDRRKSKKRAKFRVCGHKKENKQLDKLAFPTYLNRREVRKMKITLEEYEKLDPLGRSRVARQLTQKEWDKLFPPCYYPEPSDASGWSGEVECLIID